MSELKLIEQVPCPFCGTEGSLMCQFFSVRGCCRSCYSMGPEVFGKDVGDPSDPMGEVSGKMMNEAIRRWNKRADLVVHAQESPVRGEEAAAEHCGTGQNNGQHRQPKISPELNMVLDMAQDGRIIAMSCDTEAAVALKSLHDYRAKLRAGA